MSDNPTQQMLEILARLETGQASFAAGLASLEAGLASFGNAQTLLGTAQTSLRVDLMARMDRLQDGITAIRDDIAVNIGAVEAGRRANDNAREDLRTLGEQVSVMWKQLKRLQTDMREIRGGSINPSRFHTISD